MPDPRELPAARAWIGLLALAFAPEASAQMLDVDGLLVEASAVPDPGTLRVFASGGGLCWPSAGAGGGWTPC